jgi:toxin ParE1/3/4
MKARLIVSDAARRDSRAILEYLEEQAGVKIALQFALQFDSTVDRLAEFPLSGSPRRQYGPNVRLMVANPYLIFYEVAAEQVIVLRVLHGHRNITRKMLRETR